MIDLYKVWKRQDIVILRDISFQVASGEFVLLVGPSGAGKSTVLRLIHFDERPTDGKVIVYGYDSSQVKRAEIPYIRRKIGFIFQDFKLLRDRNVADNVAFAMEVTGAKRGTIKRKVMQALAMVGMSHRRNSMPYELSGGEQQRVAIARALVHDPLILLADEPTGDLDSDSADEIFELLRQINNRGTSVLMATHDISLIRRMPYRHIRIEAGNIVSQGGP
jgi:cell division transport system ATP-binding protein